MLNIKFTGYFNNGLKMQKKNDHQNGTTGFFFFYFLIKNVLKINGSFTQSFFRKNKYNIYFIKSCIRYKISKHLINRLCNRFSIQLSVKSCPNNNDFLYSYKDVMMFSSVYFNTNFIRISKASCFTKHFII